MVGVGFDGLPTGDLVDDCLLASAFAFYTPHTHAGSQADAARRRIAQKPHSLPNFASVHVSCDR